jgi:phage N-6-adenine-methyltransferase
MTGAALNRHASRQDYATPADLIAAVEWRFGVIGFDLAAEAHNTKSASYFSPRDNSLKQVWHAVPGLLWLNPPFATLAPWASKCAAEAAAGARIALLVPAAVGSNWFRDYVLGKALVCVLNPRPSFDGRHAYPKDVLLAVYGHAPGFEVWQWRQDLALRRAAR